MQRTFTTGGLILAVLLILGLAVAGAGDDAAAAPPPTFTVDSTADDGDANPGDGVCRTAPVGGVCTLRAAIQEAAYYPGSAINFNILGLGTIKTISPASQLPAISHPVTIDATTQPGYLDRPVIELDGSKIGGSPDGLNIGSTSATVRGLAINGFAVGINIVGSSGVVLEGNYIGTEPDGAVAAPNDTGVNLYLSDGNVIGGITGTTLGGACSGDCNLISGNSLVGVMLSESSNNVIVGNHVGVDRSGTGALGNGDKGVFIASDTANRVLGNRINNNGGLGIDLGTPGVTPNDAGDPDAGANNLQNFPEVLFAFRDAGSTTVNFALNSTPNSQFGIEFYASPSCDASGYGEGQTLLYGLDDPVLTDGSGDYGPSAFAVPVVVPAGHVITAVAIDTAGNTSEFSACKAVVPIQCAPGDSDCDGYSDAEETGMGKDANVYCAIMRADVDHNSVVNLLDLAQTAQFFAQTVPPAQARYDQGPPDQFDYTINLLDLAREALVYAQYVSACP